MGNGACCDPLAGTIDRDPHFARAEKEGASLMAKYARKLPGSGAIASIGYEPPDPAKPDLLWSAAERYTGPLDDRARAKLGHIVWTYTGHLEAENNADL